MDAGLINSIILSLINAVMFFYALYGVVRAARYKASGWDFLTAFRDGECRV